MRDEKRSRIAQGSLTIRLPIRTSVRLENASGGEFDVMVGNCFRSPHGVYSENSNQEDGSD